ncbi:MAG: GNAT family N-acetyltransferase [Planctomycetes bacterium]|nr:GNAT family N-acetyltransferase [Planctomycetota bacterium]
MTMRSTAPSSSPRRVRVEQIERSAERRRFVEYARALYRDDPAYVPPLTGAVLHQLDERKNPFFAHAEQALFLAREGGCIRGRIAAIVDRDLQERHGRAVGVFGFLEAEDDAEVFGALLEAATLWLRERGVKEILGPIQHSTNYEAGLLVEGFGVRPALMMTYNPPYYAPRLEALGLAKAMDLLAFRIVDAGVTDERFRRIASRARERAGISLRTLDLAFFERELDGIRRVYNEAWQENWGFVPLRDAEFRTQAREMRRIVRPQLVVLAEKDGAVVAFAMALPDVNPALAAVNSRIFPFGWLRLPFLMKRVRAVRVVTLGVLEGFRHSGIEAAMILEIIDRGRELGFNEAELSWVLETNQPMIKTIEAVGGVLSKRYRLYGAELETVLANSRS